MNPREASITIHHLRREPVSMSVDGNTPVYRTVEETEEVAGYVWPVSMGEDKVLVEFKNEYEGSHLSVTKIWDIRLV